MAQTVFITGASSGIGKATAKHFQANGWNVVATMRNPDDGAELAALDNVMVARVDVTDHATLQPAVDAAVERFGAIDVLVNNAGYGAYGQLEAFSMERIERQFDTNVIGLLAMTKAVIPQMRAQGSGMIINISSIGGKITFPFGTLYHGTKFAVEGISESLSWEMKEIGVTVKIVEPGGIDTDFAGRSLDLAVDPSMSEYLGLVGRFQAAMQNVDSEYSSPELVAGVIWTAATDGTSTMRYRAGDDAEAILSLRANASDEEVMAVIGQRFEPQQ